MKSCIAAGIIALAFASNASAKAADETCNGAEISDICFNLRYASIEKSHDAGSEKVFAVVYELHADAAMQENVFFTIEELINENNAGFLAMEYFQGEFVFNENTCSFTSYPLLYYSTASIFGGIGCNVRQEQRRNNALYYVRADSTPLGAAALFEIIYADELTTFGMDDRELRRRAHSVGMSMTEADIPIYEDIIIRQRSIAFVQHIEEYIDSNETGRAFIVSTGLSHRESLEAELERKGYSYVSILPYERVIEE
ncbi:MAG: hypothetical protein V1734_06815 [Nanoarchaeota archaeon]